MATLLGMDVASDQAAGVERTQPWPPATVAGELAMLPGQFGLLVLVLLAVTSEYGTGSIATSLQWTSRRGVLLLTRTAVATATAVLAGLLLVVVADVVTSAVAPVLELTPEDLAGSLAGVAGVLAGGALLAAGLGFLLRSTAGALSTVFLLMLVLPLVLPGFGIGWLETVGAHLPGGAAVHLLGEEVDGLTRTSASVVLAAWAAAATAAGAVSFLRRDAD
jgi:ABC-2 type transport system permease protein